MRSAFAAFLLLACARASGYPLLSLRPGGTPFEGPTDFDPTAAFWNPAALGAVHGKHIELSGTLLGRTGSYDRASIDPSTGLPGAGASIGFPSQSLADVSLRGFGGATWDFGTDTITFGFAFLQPWDSTPTFRDAGGDARLLPSQYQVVSESFRELYFSAGLGLRLHPQWLVGVAISAIDSFTDYTFYRDAALDGGSAGVGGAGGLCGASPCGYENPLAAQRIRVRGDGGSFWGGIPVPSGIGMNWGIMHRPIDRLWIGISWQHVFPLTSHGSGYDKPYETPTALDAEVQPAPGQGDPCRGPCRGPDTIAFALPDVFHVGARIEVTDTIEISTWIRLVVYGGYGSSNDPGVGNLEVRLGGDPVSRAGAPEQILLARSLTPAAAFEGGVRWRPLPSLRLALSFVAETSAIPEKYVTVEALDGPKVDPMVGLEWRPRPFFRLGLSYGVVVLLPRNPAPGAFDPQSRVACVDAAYATSACGDEIGGRAWPTAAGRYTAITQQATGTIGFDF